ncbi:MAG: 2OG-Fe(II) oxygenase [Caulobacterales bacterium]|jgi:Rps23 Pro-64 3,4-dihydroxylase Tpa1-like proline 4-hydroxylase|nr:2OG-Fe(II) oxygenase [Caulobacterales bacterium]
MLKLNPAIDPAPFARAYAATKCVQIPNLFDAESAAALERVLLSLPWRLVCQNDEGQNLLLTKEQLQALSAADIERLDAGIRKRAARNVGFTYFTYPMIEAVQQRWDPGHPIHALTHFLNSPPFIEFARTLIACPGLTKIDAQASNYQPGHFLTRHIDDGLKKERRAAYTLGFSRNWQPDWGGLLMFIDENLDVARALTPRFNTLTVFDGLLVHSVSPVSQFAPNPRLSVVGWFRDDPIPR